MTKRLSQGNPLLGGRGSPVRVTGLATKKLFSQASRHRVGSLVGLVADHEPFELRAGVDRHDAGAIRGSRVSSAPYPADENRGGVQLRVEDDGAGFSDAALASAFEPFNTAASEDNGAGLGLAMAYTIAVAHGGSASAANRPGRGAVVTLRIR